MSREGKRSSSTREKVAFLLSRLGINGEQKLAWLIPMVFALLAMAVLVVFGSGGAVFPFIYSRF